MYFTDRTDRVPLREMAAMRQTLELFHRRFPQCLFSVFVADLPRGSSASEYAFWLANRARFSSLENVRGENFDLLLVIGFSGHTAALNVGYGLEEHLREDDLQRAIEAFSDTMRHGKLPAAVQVCTDALAERLQQRWIALHEQSETQAAAPENAPKETWA